MRRNLPLIGAVLLVMATAFGCANSPTAAPTAPTAPQSIAGFKQLKLVTGTAAIGEMSDLHGKEVGVTGGWVGYYDGRAIIWTAETKGEAQAAQLLTAMEQRIGAGNKVFTNLQKLQVDGSIVFSVIGMGQKHYFYQKSAKVIWIAAPNGAEDQFLRQSLAEIK